GPSKVKRSARPRLPPVPQRRSRPGTVSCRGGWGSGMEWVLPRWCVRFHDTVAFSRSQAELGNAGARGGDDRREGPRCRRRPRDPLPCRAGKITGSAGPVDRPHRACPFPSRLVCLLSARNRVAESTPPHPLTATTAVVTPRVEAAATEAVGRVL